MVLCVHAKGSLITLSLRQKLSDNTAYLLQEAKLTNINFLFWKTEGIVLHNNLCLNNKSNPILSLTPFVDGSQGNHFSQRNKLLAKLLFCHVDSIWSLNHKCENRKQSTQTRRTPTNSVDSRPDNKMLRNTSMSPKFRHIGLTLTQMTYSCSLLGAWLWKTMLFLSLCLPQNPCWKALLSVIYNWKSQWLEHGQNLSKVQWGAPFR